MKKDIIEFSKVIGEPNRILILGHLKKECCVGELWKKLGLSQNLTSHHLRILRDAGLIIPEKRGLKVVYRLNKIEIRKKLNDLRKYLG